MAFVTLLPKEEDRILKGHPWVYGNEVRRIDGAPQSGDIVDVFSASGTFIGKGFYNSASKILIRLLTRQEETIDDAFFERRLKEANERRLQIGMSGHYRMFFAEADFIPGLIIDRYQDILVVQILTLGVEVRKADLVRWLVTLFQPKGIYERSDVSVRAKEGLEERKGVLYGSVPDEIIVEEEGLQFAVDVKNGQKTGMFLDQAVNHRLVAQYAKGARVLDCFSHIGQFALHAARGGASFVEAVDLSQMACDRIEKNASLNHLQVQVTKANVFHFLRDKLSQGVKYDLIILDPPAFTKTKQKLQDAYRGYKEINLQAMHLIEHGGILISASCSQHMTPSLFFEMLQDAADDAGKIIQMMDFRIQSPDHPTLLSSEETLYLKLVVARVFDSRKEGSL